jgi:hypothetical protein
MLATMRQLPTSAPIVRAKLSVADLNVDKSGIWLALLSPVSTIMSLLDLRNRKTEHILNHSFG